MTEQQSTTAPADRTGTKRPKTRVGIVTSAKMQKTIVVSFDRLVKHPLYKKYIRRTKKFYAHDEANEAREGDTVEISEVTRPLSRTKRWKLVRVVERAK
ncbi:MAG: 30S ribosomal protein S17 [Candidatus Sumerlaeia bacterium]|nr:30S ribosomal protein S17 [Candidatus Sumerlaeia bacterium]